jgi:hypothetical protein
MNRLFVTAFISIVLTVLHLGCSSTASPGNFENAIPSPTNSDDGNGSSDTSPSDANSAGQLIDDADTHEDADDCSWDNSNVAHIALNGSSITVDSAGASVVDTTLTIASAGTYEISGLLTNGRIVVDTEDDAVVRLILNRVDITNSTTAPIYIASAEKVIIVLADGTESSLVDGASYIFDDQEAEEPRAALFSKSDLTICGDGALTVDGNYNDAISSQDGLVIAGGTITVNSVDDGIRGKDYVVIHDGAISVSADGNGLLSDNEEDTDRGFISIDGGEIDVASGGDGLSAASAVLISGGYFALFSGGGSDGPYNTAVSAKGIKGQTAVVIDDGDFEIDSADDGLHSNGTMTINGGDFVIASGDDGVHANEAMHVNGGKIRITESYEGLESNSAITISSGEIRVASRDDGVNVASGNDGSGNGGPGFPGPPGWNDQSSGDYYLFINGGYLAIVADGDGIDVNGSVEMSGGVVLIDGPTADNNGALDHVSFRMSGGLLVGVGSAGMVQAPSTTSTQRSLKITYSRWRTAGTLIHLETANGVNLLTFAPAKMYRSCVFSSPDLQAGTSFDLYQGGNSTGTVTDGLYEGGTYAGGTLLGTGTADNVVTHVSVA